MDKAILAAVNTGKQNIEYELLELRNLAEACNIEVVDEMTQNLDRIHSTTYFGKGKLKELKELLTFHNANLVIFNDELSPAQVRTIEKELKVTVFDRTYIILEIFKRRAQTKEAILQVEIASLNYLLPRLVGMREGLSRQRGAAASFQHGRGGGETKLELDRRFIQDRISALNKELNQLTKKRQVQRLNREKNNTPVIAIVGYTNSGKSTLLNQFLDISLNKGNIVYEKDMLFATLETSTRRIKFENKPEFLMTDTVGFIEKLPHDLIEAFKSTLEEITDADLIIHVVDSTNNEYDRQIKTTNQVLDEIGVKDITQIYAFNKVDLLNSYLYIEPEYSHAVKISAKTGENIDLLVDMIFEELFKEYSNETFLIPFENGNLVSYLEENHEVSKTQYLNNGTKITVFVPKSFKNKYKDFII